MTSYGLYAVDLVAIAILVFALFLPRHGRPELVVALLTTNVGVLAVASALSNATIGAGVGLGLFGVLSIIRLRSEELTQSDIAYYFAALTLGLLGGLGQAMSWRDVTLMALVLGAVAIGDSPLIAKRPLSQQIVLDQAYTDQASLVERLEGQLGSAVVSARIIRADLVNDTTVVDVRYRPGTGVRATEAGLRVP